MEVRVSLAGRLVVEVDGERTLDERQFRGRQARGAFADLVFRRERPVPRDELAQLLWGSDQPPAWQVAVSVLVSRLQALVSASPLGTRGISVARASGSISSSCRPRRGWT